MRKICVAQFEFGLLVVHEELSFKDISTFSWRL